MVKWFVVFCVFCAFVAALQGATVHDVIRSGRAVQIDGFLVEWDKMQARMLDTSTNLTGDFISTPVGLTGYFIVASTDTCPLLEVSLFDLHLGSSPLLTIRLDSADAATRHSAMQRVSTGSAASVVVEWLLSWSKLGIVAGEPYRLNCVVSDRCSGMIVAGFEIRSVQPKQRFITDKIKIQLMIIAALLGLYLFLKIKVGKRTKRTNRFLKKK